MLDNPDWNEQLSSLPGRLPPHGHSEMQSVAQHFIDAGDAASADEAKVLVEATSFVMSADALEFHPMWADASGRTALPEDFDAHKQSVLLAALDRDLPAPLEARLRDILWIQGKHDSDGQLAAAAYLEAAELLHPKELWPIPVECLRRAIHIASRIRDEDLLKQAIELARRWLAEYVDSEDEGHGASGALESLRVAGAVNGNDLDTAMRFAGAALDRGDSRVYRSYLELAERIANSIGDAESAKTSRRMAAESWERDAEAAREQGDGLKAVFFFDEAVTAFRRVGGAGEDAQRVLARQLECQELAADQMQTIEFTMADVSIGTIIEGARTAVRDKSVSDALAALAGQPVSSVDALSEYAKASTGLTDLFTRVTFDDRARIIGRSSNGLAPADVESKSKLIRAAIDLHGFFAATWIQPAVALMREQHLYLPSRAILPFIVGSPLVAPERLTAFGRALELGLAGELSTAIPKLVGEFENGVREFLRARGVAVTRMDQYGIQRERDLNELLFESEWVAAVGDDLALDLQATLVENSGSNVRNRVAHGLVSPEQYEAADMQYAFWLMLKMLGLRLKDE